MQTTVGVGDPRAVRRWATSLATQVDYKSYFAKRGMIGTGENNIIERKVDLENEAGDTVQFDLSMPLRGGMTTGDDRVEGKAESLVFYTDGLKIDQARMGVSAGGRMTRKRTLHDLRRIARDRAGAHFARWTDEMYFAYLSSDTGLTGINQSRIFDKPTGFAGNAITAPDSAHIIYGGAATSKATITVDDKMSWKLLERVSVKPSMMSEVDPDVIQLSPVDVEGEERFVALMNPWQAHDLRVETGDVSWTKIQQALATSLGRNSPLVKGGLGLVNGMILHEHSGVVRWTDGGAGSNVHMARALLLGRQAGAVAYGSAGKGARMTWVEKLTDADNMVEIYCGTIMGMKKTRFNNLDFGVVAIDTAAKDPNAA